MVKTLRVSFIFIFCLLSCIACEEVDKVKEMEVEKVTITDITGNSAVLKIHRNDLTNGYLYINEPTTTRMYYGTSPNVTEMTEYVVGTTGSSSFTGTVKDHLVYNLHNLKDDTEYWFALKLDTIYAKNSNGVRLVNDQGDKGLLVPLNNSFTTSKELAPIDLGLSVLWAQADLGSDEWWYTPLYSWSVENYTNKNRPATMNIAGTSQDHATVMLGEDWHTPTIMEYNELIANCDFTVRFDDEWGGFVRCTSRVNGKYIDFSPNSGALLDSWIASYWTSSVADMGDPNYSLWKIYKIDFPSDLNVDTEFVSDMYYSSTKKAQIRPVKKK